MLFGTCYYPEHWPQARWETDAKLMQAAGIELIRVGEFAWSVMEPTEGDLQWAWLDEVVELFGRYGIKTLLGTPTATPPIWLTRRTPDILRVDSNLLPREHGGRKHYCPNSPTYRVESKRIVNLMAERYGNNPNVIGWQIDNEFGENESARCHCGTCQTEFQAWLQAKYGAIDTLNEAWGNAFWSQNYTKWDEIPLPNVRNPRPNPCQTLDFYRFSTDSFVAYQQDQIDIIRTANRDHFITHNYMGLFPDLDGFKLAAPYDFASWDNYPTGFSERFGSLLNGTKTGDTPYAFDVGDPLVIGMSHALMYGLKQRPHWVMEHQCGYINWGVMNPMVRPGTPRLWVYHSLAEGVETVVFFRWRATLMAHEQYHSGLIKHDGTPDVGYNDLLRLQEERETIDAIRDGAYAADVALIYDYDDLWSQQLQPHREGWHYIKIVYQWYTALRKAGVNVHLVSKHGDLSAYSTVISPSAHIVDDAFVQKMTTYAEQGGTAVFGVRSGFKTPSNLVTDQPLPGALRDLVGATVAQWGSLPDGVARPLTSELDLGGATVWCEMLEVERADAIATYNDGRAGMTVNAVGSGRAVYVGWLPTQAQVVTIANYLGIETMTLPDGVIAQKRGDKLVLLNFTDETQTITANQHVNRPLSIEPRDVVVL